LPESYSASEYLLAPTRAAEARTDKPAKDFMVDWKNGRMG
jgi:hypothetical protein